MADVKKFRDDLKLIKELDNEVEELYITSRFPPLTDVSGIVFSKRIIDAGKKVDVVCSDIDGDKDEDFNNLINNFIEDKIVIDGIYPVNSIPCIKYFIEEGLKKISELGRKYTKVVSRAWTVESHFLALEYKLQNPDVFWTAEFSDPISLDFNNDFRGNRPFKYNEEFFSTINEHISDINKKEFGDNVDRYFPEIKNGDELYLLVEYLPYLFADVVRFTNENQRKIMLDSIPIDINDFVLNKSEVLKHPISDNEFYTLRESSYNVNKNYLNFAYFGTYVGKRHLEYLFKSLEELTDEVRHKIKLHMFVPNPEVLKANVYNLNISRNIEIGGKLPVLEFLNLTTKMDVLIVNDTMTEGVFDINPFLPSKLADYLGSGRDIWIICEKGSVMDSYDVKYKSYINDYESSRDVLGKIIRDKLGQEDVFNVLDSDYYQDRLTNLNNVIHDLYGQRMYWFNQSNLTKNKLNELNSNFNIKNKRLDFLENKYDSLMEEVDLKNKRIDSLNNNCDTLINDVHVRDVRIDSLMKDIELKDESIISLEKDYDSLMEDILFKEGHISELSDELTNIQKEKDILKNRLDVLDLEKTELNNEYEDLHKITKNSFDLIEAKDNIIQNKNDSISSLEKDNVSLRKDIDSKEKHIKKLSDELDNLNDKMNIVNSEKIELISKYEELREIRDDSLDLIEAKDNIIQNKNDSISSLEKDNASLRKDINSKKEHIGKLSNELNNIQDERNILKNKLEIINQEKLELTNECEKLCEIAESSFDLIELKDSIIRDKNEELNYYKNQGNLFNTLISNPLSNIYLIFASSTNERDLNRKLFKCLKNSNWFNVAYYLKNNMDISRFKWVKLLSPELHYVCHGFDEKRRPNNETDVIYSKQELIEKLS
ncbi:hypothetical protein [Methanobrevibacter sp.]|uniref:hypothetical protein n=1 Tax=Methanobrevibacter sp. TaxID=66852 RepID=UPI00389089FF